MRKKVLNLLSLLGLALAMALFMPHRAAADDDDPPSRVARLSYISGNVSFEPAGTEDWVSAVVNRPITTGDKVWSDNGGRAELNMGSAAIRLSSNTGFSFLNLDDRTTQIRITEGVINVRVRRLDQDENFEIDTPNLAFSILREGDYKIDVNEAGDSTIVTVRNGEGEVTGGGSTYALHPRETGTFAGIDQLDADIQDFRNYSDDFDRFCNDRDRRADRSISSRYVSSDVIGYEDLDDNGGWRQVPEYGTVWFPHTTIVGWAPYRYGHWAWISPWGWTWVDDAPWGFAPFHYGRWVTVRGVWGWVPCAPRAVVGVAYVRPVYAPALVAWVGGPHFSVGIGIGGGGGAGVAWFPLGPREVYVPSYHVSRTYVTRVNVSNTTVNNTVVNNYYNTVVVNKNVTNIRYVNQSAPNGVTATSQENFRTARPVGRNMMRIDRRDVESAQVNVTTPTVAPEQRSVLGSGAATRVRPPARLQERAVVAKTPPPAAPVSFVRQQQEIQANGGRPPAMSQMRQPRGGNNDAQPRSNIRMAPPATAGAPQNGQGNNRPGQQQYNEGNRRGQQQRNDQNNSNRSVAPNNNAGQPPSNTQNNPNRPSTPGNPGQPQRDVRNNPNKPAPPDNAGQPPSNIQDNSNRPSAPGNPGQPPPDVRNNPNKPAPPDNARQPRSDVQNDSNRPPASNSGGQPPQGNQPGNPPRNNGRDRSYQDRPASSRPNNTNPVPPPVSPQLDQKQRQQDQQLHQRQDQERQRVEQKQVQEQQKVQQKNADDARRQQVDQRQQQQLQQLEQKHQQEQQRLQQAQQQKQQQEQQRAQQNQRQQQRQQQPKPDNKPAKDKKDKEPPPRNP